MYAVHDKPAVQRRAVKIVKLLLLGKLYRQRLTLGQGGCVQVLGMEYIYTARRCWRCLEVAVCMVHDGTD